MAQLAVVVVAGSLMAAGQEGSPALAVVLALAAVVYLPVVALIGGALVALAYVLPVLAFAEWAAGHRGGSVPAWRAGAVLGLGALYAVPFGVGDPSGYLLTWALVCLSAVLPLTVADRTDRTDRAGGTAGGGTGRAGRLRLAPWVWGFALFWLAGVVIGCAALLAP
ncbi:hypothetical protein ABZ714_13940 [Streptomyces sp. NPDC006798]|uniref:hypothetical protein n=1 Tax=Streptomyces sp. NPDC006798 TaxID=3155462 RepID=UPI0033DA728C